MSELQKDAAEGWETAVGSAALVLLFLLILACFLFGWTAVLSGALWLIVLAAAVGAIACAAMANDGEDQSAAGNYWIASAVCASAGVLAWFCLPAAALPTQSHRYWEQLREVWLRLEATNSSLGETSSGMSADQLALLMKKNSEHHQNAALEVRRLPISHVDEEIVQHAAELSLLLNETSALSTSLAVQIEEAVALGEYSTSLGMAVEAFARGFFGDVFGKYNELNAAFSQLEARWSQLEARQERLRERTNELEAREMKLRATLAERYGGGFPPLHSGSAPSAPAEQGEDKQAGAQPAGEQQESKQQESNESSDVAVGHPLVVAFKFIYSWFGIPGVVAATLIIIHLVRTSGSAEGVPAPVPQGSVSSPELPPYEVCLFRLLGHIAKSDGAVARAEIRAAEECMELLRFNPRQREQAINQFREGKLAPNASPLVKELARAVEGNADLKEPTIRMVLLMAAADGDVAEPEKAVIRSLHSAMMPMEFAVEDELRSLEENSPYRILGITPPADATAIKRAYRAKCREYHPDHLGTKKLPPEMEAFAAERLRKVQEAYATLIAEAR